MYRNEYRKFKLSGPPWEVDKGGVKRTGRGESPGTARHIGMATAQGNSLSSHLYLKLAKHHVSCLIFIFYIFLLQNRRTGGQNRFCSGCGGAIVTGGRGSGREGVADKHGTNSVYTCMSMQK
jgi:hypothetical protein